MSDAARAMMAQALYTAMATSCHWPFQASRFDALVPALQAPYLAMADVALEQIAARDESILRLVEENNALQDEASELQEQTTALRALVARQRRFIERQDHDEACAISEHRFHSGGKPYRPEPACTCEYGALLADPEGQRARKHRSDCVCGACMSAAAERARQP